MLQWNGMEWESSFKVQQCKNIVSKNASNKNCLELNFLHKTQWNHMSLSSRSGARGLERLPWLKYYNVMKWESRFTLRLNTAQIFIISKKASNKNCPELNFLHKTQWKHISSTSDVDVRACKHLALWFHQRRSAWKRTDNS